MVERDGKGLSPIVTKALDECARALRENAIIPDANIDRLDALIRSGKVPKADEIRKAVFPAKAGDGE